MVPRFRRAGEGVEVREDLSRAEQDLVQAAGGSNDCRVDFAGSADRAIRGWVLADVLRDRRAEPTRLTVCHATVTERLDLRGSTLATTLCFTHVTFDEPPSFAHARLPGLSLVDCTIPGAELTGMTLGHEFSIIDGTVTACLRLSNARLGQGLRIANVSMTGTGNNVALAADWIRAGASVTIESARASGTLLLTGAVIEGHLTLDNSQLDGRGQYALNAKLARIDGNLYLRGAHVEGELRLGHIAINGDLDLRRTALDQDGSPAALSADTGRITGRVRMSDGFTAHGEVSFVAARLRDIDAAHARLAARRRCLFLDRADIVNDVSLRDVQASGEISLADTRIGGALDLDHATIEVDDPATIVCLRADNSTIAGDVTLDGTTLTGGARLPGATMGQLVLADLTVIRPGSTAISLRHAEIRSRLLMRNTRIDGLFDLRESRMNDLDDTVDAWDGVSQLDLDGLTYHGLATAGWTVDQRLAWVRRSHASSNQSASFSPGPYEQLVRTYRTRGESALATRVLMARENDRLAADHPHGPADTMRHLGRYALKVLVGHGYRPGRAIWYLLALIAALGLFFALGPNHAYAITSVDGLPRREFNPFLYAADTVLPVVDLGESDSWRADPSQPWGSVYRATAVAAIVAGWILSTAIVAALARLARSE
jgi:hypothetical protein